MPKGFPEKSLNGQYDYDMIVIGGGSGGLACSKEVTKTNPLAKVACFDYVAPSPQGTKWGLGGTCVNVGCIPKKLMHYSALLGHSMEDARALGWEGLQDAKHDWNKMLTSVNDMIRGLNYGYKKALKDAKVEYINALAHFVDEHTVEYTNRKGTFRITSDKFVIAVGGRPVIPDVPGAKEYGITSDDIFWWSKPPGKTLVVGASYIALECAGFLHAQGHDVTVMVRSILLRGFDRQCSEQIGEVMERQGMKFIQPATVTKIVKEDGQEKLMVTYENRDSKEQFSEEYDSVMFAIGRKICGDGLGLDVAGVKVENGKVVVNDVEQTTTPHVYAIGDVIPQLELTPVAIKAGQLLAQRLYGNSDRKMDYTHVPTTVFTPLEYGACGLSEEDADKLLGKENVEVFSSRYGALEQACTEAEMPEQRSHCFTWKNLRVRKERLAAGLPFEDYELGSYEQKGRSKQYMKQNCLAKLVCDKTQDNKVVGFHYLGPDAGEVTQGFALAVKLGATKDDFDNLVGIHPTCAEEFTTLKARRSNGDDYMKAGGC